MEMKKSDLVLNIIDYIERSVYSDDYDETLFKQMETYLNTLYQDAIAEENSYEE